MTFQKYIVTLPNATKVEYDDYTAAKRHAQLICQSTVWKPQLIIKKYIGNKWQSELIIITNL